MCDFNSKSRGNALAPNRRNLLPTKLGLPEKRLCNQRVGCLLNFLALGYYKPSPEVIIVLALISRIVLSLSPLHDNLWRKNVTISIYCNFGIQNFNSSFIPFFLLVCLIIKSMGFAGVLVFLMVALFGSGALSGKMLLVRIVKNSNIPVYFRAG